MDTLTCVVCGKPATQKYLTIRSDVDPIYASVCDECAVKHTWQCIDTHLQIANYKHGWPNYCRECGGWGGFVDHGTYLDPPTFDDCNCLLDCRCPRCGHRHDKSWDGEYCEDCYWRYYIGGIPESECHCGETDDDWWQEEPFSYNDLPDHDY